MANGKWDTLCLFQTLKSFLKILLLPKLVIGLRFILLYNIILSIVSKSCEIFRNYKHLFSVYFILFLKQGLIMWPWMYWKSLCRPPRPWPHRDLSAFTFQTLRLKVHTTIPHVRNYTKFWPLNCSIPSSLHPRILTRNFLGLKTDS